MISWVSIAVIVFLVGILAFGWFRGWSMMLTLIVAMAVTFVTGVATAARLADNVFGSPLLEDLAWRPAYFALDAWMHWPTALTTMFLHADVAHILVNVIVFAFMGMGFEERVGRGRFLATFVVSGVIGTLLHSVTNLGGMGAHVPVVGASGAVFGIIGAYATLFPRDRVVLFVFLIIPNVPVYIAALVYTVVEVVALNAFGAAGGVARYAHVGGIVGGALMAFLLMRMGQLERSERGAPRKKLEVHAGVEALIQTERQRTLYDNMVKNRDEPEVATAWLEKLARDTPCPKCGEPLEATGGSLRSACGYKLAVTRSERSG